MRTLLLSLLLLTPIGVFAQSAAQIASELERLTPDQQLQYQGISDQLRCPTCTGLSILQSDAPFSQQIKSLVIEQVAKGQSQPQIMAFFTERYGLWIRREPPAQGFHLLAWLLPLGFLLITPFFLWALFFRKTQVMPSSGMRTTSEILDEMTASLESLRQKNHRSQETL